MFRIIQNRFRIGSKFLNQLKVIGVMSESDAKKPEKDSRLLETMKSMTLGPFQYFFSLFVLQRREFET